MKVFVLIALLLAVAILTDVAAGTPSVAIAWNPVVAPEVTQIRAYVATLTGPGVLWSTFPQGVTNGVLSNLNSGVTYRFWLVSATAEGVESLPSTILTNYVAVGQPTNLRVISFQ